MSRDRRDRDTREEYSRRQKRTSSHRDRSRRAEDSEEGSEGEGEDGSLRNRDDEEASDHRRRKKSSKRKKKHSKESRRKRHKRDSKRRKRDRYYSDESDASDDSRDSEERHKKRKRKKKHTKNRRDANSENDEESLQRTETTTLDRNHLLTQALARLFQLRPVFSQELPILLIRLAGGSNFDFRQMNDSIASESLEGVFRCLEEYGVQKKEGEWTFEAPPGRRDERVLLRVIRSQLDEVGITLEAVNRFETEMKNKPIEKAPPTDNSDIGEATPMDSTIQKIKTMTSELVLKFQDKDAALGSQLAGLCQTIAQGENISIDGLPNTELKELLVAVFEECGLTKSEIVDEDSDDSGADDGGSDDVSEKVMGYGLPEGEDESAVLRLAAVMQSCRNPKRRVLGPAMPTAQDREAATRAYQSDEDDEGPLSQSDLTKGRRGPSLPAHVIRAQAEYRALELKATAAGIDVPVQGGGREEWMVVPGKHDFLSNIKSGQPIKSRGFQNKKTRDGGAAPAPVHPAIRAEMDAIMKAHEDARGPSLMDEHRAKIQREKTAAAGKKEGWTWSRDKDLDAGRRVDKDALHMVLGGAADNLKTKFKGGFN